jgi:molybdopterin converting factor small subunit
MGTGRAAEVKEAAAGTAGAGADGAGPSVSIRYLSAVREQAGRRRDEVRLPSGSTLAVAADWVRAHRGIEVPGSALMSTLNGHGWAQLPDGLATVLREGDEIAFFPLLSGG